MTVRDFSAVDRQLNDGVGQAFPGAVASVWQAGQCVYHRAVGTHSIMADAPPTSEETIYDLASLTKPMAVGTLLMRAVSEGQMDLGVSQCKPMSSPSPDPVQSGDDSHWDRLTTAQIASHCSGLPAWCDFGSALRHKTPAIAPATPEAQQWIKNALRTTPLVAEPGSRVCYSDLGYMALGWALERHLGAPLDTLFEWVRTAFDLESTGYRPLGDPADPRIAPTERCPTRGRTLLGEVHDPNAWVLGGVAGHAGLFGTAMDVARWANGLLAVACGQAGPLPVDIVHSFWRPDASPSHSPGTWRLCFDGISVDGSSAGSHFGQSAVGHLGYTGTSVWIEVQRRLVVVLLSNRVHPTDHPNPAIKRFRPRFHDAVYRALFE